MKKIREHFYMIAAAVICVVISIQAKLFSGNNGHAIPLKTGYDAGVLHASDLVNPSFMREKTLKTLKAGNYIRKVFFWLGGPGDKRGLALSGTPPLPVR